MFATALAFNRAPEQKSGGGAAVASCDALNLDRKATLSLWVQPDPALVAEPQSNAAASSAAAATKKKPLLSAVLASSTPSSGDGNDVASPIMLLGRAPAGRSYSLELVWDDTSFSSSSSLDASGDRGSITSNAQSGAAASEDSSNSEAPEAEINTSKAEDTSEIVATAASSSSPANAAATKTDTATDTATATAAGAPVPRFMVRLLVVRDQSQVPVMLLSCAPVCFGEWQHVAATFDGAVVTLVVTQGDVTYTDSVAADGSGMGAATSSSNNNNTNQDNSAGVNRGSDSHQPQRRKSLIMGEDEVRVSGCARCGGAFWLPHNHPVGGNDSTSSNSSGGGGAGGGGGGPQRGNSMQAMQRDGSMAKKKSGGVASGVASGGAVSLATAMGDLRVGSFGFIGAIAEIGVFNESLGRPQVSRLARCGLLPFTCDTVALRPAPHSFPSKLAIAACAARCLAAGYDLDEGDHGAGIDSLLSLDWSKPEDKTMKKMLKDNKSPLKLVQELLGGDHHVDYVEVVAPSDQCLLGLGPSSTLAALFHSNSSSQHSQQSPEVSIAESSVPFVNDAAVSCGSPSAQGAPNRPPLIWYDGRDGCLVIGRRRRPYGPPFGRGDVVGVGRSLKTASAFFTLNGAWLGNLTPLLGGNGSGSRSEEVPFVGVLQAALATRATSTDNAGAAAAAARAPFPQHDVPEAKSRHESLKGEDRVTLAPPASIQWVHKHSKLAFDPRCLPYLQTADAATMVAIGATLDVSFEVTPVNTDTATENVRPAAVAGGTWTASLRFDSTSSPGSQSTNLTALLPIGKSKLVQGSLLLRPAATPHGYNLTPATSESWVPFTGVISGHALYVTTTTTSAIKTTQSNSSGGTAADNQVDFCLALPPHYRPGEPCAAQGTVAFCVSTDRADRDSPGVLKWSAVAPVGGRVVLQLTGQSRLSIGPVSSNRGVSASSAGENRAAGGLKACAERAHGLAVSLRAFFAAYSPTTLVHGQEAFAGMDSGRSNNNLTLSLEPHKNSSKTANVVWCLVASLRVSLDGASSSGTAATDGDDDNGGTQSTNNESCEVVHVQCSLEAADLGSWLDVAVVWSHSSLSLRVNGVVAAKTPCPSLASSSNTTDLKSFTHSDVRGDADFQEFASVKHPSAWSWVLGDAMVGRLADFRVGAKDDPLDTDDVGSEGVNAVEDQGKEAARGVHAVKPPRMPIMGLEDDEDFGADESLFTVDVTEDASADIGFSADTLEPPDTSAPAVTPVTPPEAQLQSSTDSRSAESPSRDAGNAPSLDAPSLPQPPPTTGESPQEVKQSSMLASRLAAKDLARWRALAAKAACVLESRVLSCGGVMVSAAIIGEAINSEPRSIRFWCRRSPSSSKNQGSARTVHSYAWRPNRKAGAPAALLSLPQLAALLPSSSAKLTEVTTSLVGLAHSSMPSPPAATAPKTNAASPAAAPASGAAVGTDASSTPGAANDPSRSSGITVAWWCGDDESADSLGADDDDDYGKDGDGSGAASGGDSKGEVASEKPAEATASDPAKVAADTAAEVAPPSRAVPGPAPAAAAPPPVPPPEPMTEEESSVLALMLPGVTLAHARHMLRGNGNNVESAVMTMLDWGANPPSPPPLQPISGPAVNAPSTAGQGSSSSTGSTGSAAAADSTSNLDNQGVGSAQPALGEVDFAATLLAAFDDSSSVDAGAPEPAPDVIAPPPAEVCCPGGHTLNSFQTPRSGFSCDQCQRSCPADSSMYGCRECDFDLCPTCWQQRRKDLDDQAAAAQAALPARATTTAATVTATATTTTARVGNATSGGPAAARWVEFLSPIEAVGSAGGSPDGPDGSAGKAFRAACTSAIKWFNGFNHQAAAATSKGAAIAKATAAASAPANKKFVELVGGVHLSTVVSSSTSKLQASAGIWVRPSRATAPPRHFGSVFLHQSGGGNWTSALDTWLASASVAIRDVVAVTDAPLSLRKNNDIGSSSGNSSSANITPSFSLVLYQLPEQGQPLLGAPSPGGSLGFAQIGHWPLTPPDLRATSTAAMTKGSGSSADVQLPAAELLSSSLLSSSSSSSSTGSALSTAQVALVPHWPVRIMDGSGTTSGNVDASNKSIVSSHCADFTPFMFDASRSVGCFRTTLHGRALTCSRAPLLSMEAAGAAGAGSANCVTRHSQVREVEIVGVFMCACPNMLCSA